MQVGVPVPLTSKAVSNWPAWYRSKNCIRSSSKKNVLILLWLAVWPSVLYLKRKEMCTSWHKLIISIITIMCTHLFSVQKFLRFIAWINKSHKTWINCCWNVQDAVCPLHVHFAEICYWKKKQCSKNFLIAFISNDVFWQLTSVPPGILAIWFVILSHVECASNVKRPPAEKQFEIPVIIVIIYNQTK